jgi:hypothetical protein
MFKKILFCFLGFLIGMIFCAILMILLSGCARKEIKGDIYIILSPSLLSQ